MRHLILTGPPGVGKSRVGRALARKLDCPFTDLDQLIVQRSGQSISDLFQEGSFRQWERDLLPQVLREPAHVVALGGGTLLEPANLNLVLSSGVVVALQAPLEVLTARTAVGDRPLLKTRSLEDLLAERRSHYQQFPFQVDAQGDIELVVARILEQLPLGWGGASDPTVQVGPVSALGEALLPFQGRRTLLVVDEAVPHKGVLACLQEAGLAVETLPVRGGEDLKTPDALLGMWRELARRKFSRDSLLVAVGGGTVGDAAGFAAASYLRGIPVVQVPTTLLAMVDAAIGGKVAINLPEGKNLVGAFHPPALTWIDPSFVATLPRRAYLAALPEMLKSALLGDFELDYEALTEGRDLEAAVRRVVALKAAVVMFDPQEQGPRELLNLGHTPAHALEKELGYGAWLHGEAVGWGLRVVCRVTETLGGQPPSALVETWTSRWGMARRAPVKAEALWSAMGQDKKVRDGKVRFVLPMGPGQMVVRALDQDTVLPILREFADG